MDSLAKELAETVGARPSQPKEPGEVSDEVGPCATSQTYASVVSQGYLQRIVGSSIFDTVMAFVIMSNCVVININQTVRVQEDGDHTRIIKFTEVAESFFILIYILELLLRFAAYRMKCMYDASVRFDVFLVVMGVATSWILQPLLGQLEGLGPFMVLRTVRLLRLARLIRLLVIFKELWILVRGLLNSMRTMFFTLVLIFLTIYVFASIGMELIANHRFAKGSDAKPQFQEHVGKYFNSLPRTMVTLLQFVTMDNGVIVYEPLIGDDWTLVIYFVCILLVVNIVLMNLVTAVLVNSALEQTNQDKEAIKAFREKEHRALLKRLKNIFMHIDTDADGVLTREELLKICEEDRGELSKHVLVGNPLVIFDALDVDESGTISKEEFCEGIWEVAISNSPIELKRMEKQVDHIRKQTCGVNTVQDSLLELRVEMKRVLETVAPYSVDWCGPEGHSGTESVQLLLKQAAAINARLALTLSQLPTESCWKQGTLPVKKLTPGVSCTSNVFTQRSEKAPSRHGVTFSCINEELPMSSETATSSPARAACAAQDKACYKNEAAALQPPTTELPAFIELLPTCSTLPRPPPSSHAPTLMHHQNPNVTSPDDLQCKLLPLEAYLQNHGEQSYGDILPENNCTCEVMKAPRYGAPPGFIQVSGENQVEGKTDRILELQGADLVPPDDDPAVPPNFSLPIFQTLKSLEKF